MMFVMMAADGGGAAGASCGATMARFSSPSALGEFALAW